MTPTVPSAPQTWMVAKPLLKHEELADEAVEEGQADEGERGDDEERGQPGQSGRRGRRKRSIS